MSDDRKGVEFFAGLFLLVGFGSIAAMVLIFGRISQGVQKSYPLVVEFPNASGLVRGSDVFISGARVGVVARAPQLIGKSYAVGVLLNIDKSVQIPRTSSFQIRSNGMLGDSYIDITPPQNYSPSDFAQPEETIAGRRSGGFEELTSKGGEMIDKLNDEILRKLSLELDELKVATTSINTRLLNEQNLKNVEDTFSNLKSATGEFAELSKDLDAVMAKANETIDSAKSTMKTADASATELKLALGDLRRMAETATKTVDSAKVLINKASTGEGTFGALVSDKQMAADLRALVANLRRSGVLFYKDRPLPQPAATPAPGSKRRR